MKDYLPLDFFRLRALLWLKDGRYVAQCLETGNIVTADNAATAADMIAEVLHEEVVHRVFHKIIGDLYSRPAPFRVWVDYYEASMNHSPTLKGGVEIVDVSAETPRLKEVGA